MSEHSTQQIANPLDNPFVEGQIIVVDKPLGWTSFDVVNKVRYRLTRAMGIRKIKVGHAGTLDPLATGVVVLCTGRYTKRIEEIQAEEKVYEATLRLGATTPSYDLETEIDREYPYDHLSRDEVKRHLRRFEGCIAQVPPLFSAVKIGGKRAYEYARGGKEVVLEPKEIVVKSLSLTRYELPEIDLKVTCGKGTYVRALARDIGESLGCGAHLTSLRRTRVGAYRVEEALGMEEINAYIERILSPAQSHVEGVENITTHNTGIDA